MASSVLSRLLLPSGIKAHPQTLYPATSYGAKNKANWRISLSSRTQARLSLSVSLLLSRSLPLFCLCLSLSHTHACSSRPSFSCPGFASAQRAAAPTTHPLPHLFGKFSLLQERSGSGTLLWETPPLSPDMPL